MPYCYYCGSSTHDSYACSVKRLDNIADMQSRTADAIERLGHSSWDQVDTLIREQDRLVEAQERAANGEADESIRCLQYLIEGGRTIVSNTIKADRNYFVKAQIDPEFSNSRDEVNAFLQKLQQKERGLAEKAIQNAQIAIEKAQEWHVDLGFAKSKLAEAKRQFETQSYFGYQDAQPPAREAEINANDTRLKQQRQMRADAQSAIEAAQNEINDAENGLQNLTSPQKQLETPYNPNEHFQTARDKLAESQRCFDLDTHSGYLQARENAKEAQKIAAEINGQIAEFQRIGGNAQTAISNAELALRRIEEASEQQVAPDKFQTAREKLAVARENFKLRTKSGYSRAYDFSERSGSIANEIRKLWQQWTKAQRAIGDVENALQRLYSEKKAKYVQSELEEVEKKLGEARSKFELNTSQGYIEAAEIAKEVSSSKISELTRLIDEHESEPRASRRRMKRIGLGCAYVIGFAIGFAIVGWIIGFIVLGFTGAIIGENIGFLLGLVMGWRFRKK